MRVFKDPNEFIDIISSMTGRKFVTFGYVSSANLNLPQGKKLNPKTGRMIKCDDMVEFGKQIGIDLDLAGIVKLTKYNLKFMNRENFVKKYGEFQTKFKDLKTKYDYPESTRKSNGGYTNTIQYGKGVEVYSGDNDELKGKSYIRQDINGARIKGNYYLIDLNGNIVRNNNGEIIEYTKDDLRQYINTKFAPLPGVIAMRKLGRDEALIQEYIKEFDKIKMMPKSFEYNLILYMVGKANGESFLYINKNLPRVINHIDFEINPLEFIEIAEKQYEDVIRDLLQYAETSPEEINEAIDIFTHLFNYNSPRAIYEDFDSDPYKWDIYWSTEDEDELYKEFINNGDKFSDYTEWLHRKYPDENKAFPNIYEVIEYVKSIMRQEGYSDREIEDYVADAKSGNYTHARRCSAEKVQEINDKLALNFISKLHENKKHNNINKKLYESIMRNVAREVKNTLNEGAWGYKPNNSDDYLDSTHDLCEPIILFLTNLLESSNVSSKYTAIGMFNELLNANIWSEVSYGDDFKDLVENIGIAYEDLKNDNGSWQDQNEFIKQLNILKKQIDSKLTSLKNKMDI